MSANNQLLMETRQALGWSEIVARLQVRARCELGHERLGNLPFITDPDCLEREQLRLQEYSRLLDDHGSRDFAGTPDMVVRIRGGKSGREILDPAELFNAGRAVAAIADLTRFCRGKRPSLLELLPDTTELMQFMERINRSLDAQGTVLDSASPELTRLRRAVLHLRRDIERRLERMVQGLKRDGVSLEDIVTTRNDRYVIPVVAGRWQAERFILHDRSASGTTLYVEPVNILPLNNELAELRLQEIAEVQRILLALNSELLDNRDAMLAVLSACGQLDSLQARASWISRDGWKLSRVSREDNFILHQAAHPLLRNPVPISLTFSGQCRHVVLSGANAGGKTATLKTFGLFCLMAQSGLPLPTGLDCELPVFQEILVDVGDAQSLENDLSTFSAHIVSLGRILGQLEQEDGLRLVLLDELGVGSNPRQGAALACAILEHLTGRTCCSLITTHYEPVIALATRLESVENCAVRYDVEENKPLFSLDMGHYGISHSFRTARRFGLPESIIQRAEAALEGDTEKLEGLIESLERRERTLEKERRNLIRQTSKMREEKRKAAAEAETLKQKKEKAREDTARDLERQLRERLTELDMLVSEARDDAQKMRQSVRRGRVRELVRETREELQPAPQPVEKHGAIAGVSGEAVQYGSGGMAGRIADVLGNGRYRVEFATGMILEVTGDQLSPVKGERAKTSETGTVRLNIRPRGNQAALELDLRGKTVEEALKAVETYLEEVIAAGLSEVRIVHGKGTMRLAEAVTEYLRGYPQVKSHRFGKWGEGDYGVTVVSF